MTLSPIELFTRAGRAGDRLFLPLLLTPCLHPSVRRPPLRWCRCRVEADLYHAVGHERASRQIAVFYLPHVSIHLLEDLPSDGVAVGVEADLYHAVDSIQAPLCILPSLIEILKGSVRVASVPTAE